MRIVARLLCSATLLASCPALAGEEVLYRPAPEWVTPAMLPEVSKGPPVVLYDDQRRMEKGRLWTYIDRAIRIDNPQMLTGVGTLQAAWLPDKGDLIVHRVTIVRDGHEIDVLAQGAKLDVLRRERQLEQRMMDGVRTATLAVPGLRVGDLLRVSYSVTTSDQALKDEVQDTIPLPTAPFEIGFGRVRLSWPTSSDVRWRATQGLELPAPVQRDGFDWLEVSLPLPQPAAMPEDAPLRYRMPPLLQAGTFADWQEVSRTMAPLFATDGAIDRAGPIAREVAKIQDAHYGQLERAVAALRLVQDEIAYLANGMEGGNYIPQSAADTWEMRYGDCKAKTLLLLAMLREMGIEAEAVLVSTEIGDAIPELLPSAAAFDHVIVRGVIDGSDYWLDGTSSGANLQVVNEVPPFHHALPLRMSGSDLMPMSQRAQVALDRTARIVLDHSAGLDVPMLYEAEWTITGASAAPFRAVIGQASEEQIGEMVEQFAVSELGDGLVTDGKISFDESSNAVTVRASGLMTSPWRWERGIGTRPFALPTQDFEFRPDRSRQAWRDIPVAMPGPFSEHAELTVLLPETDQPYTLVGKSAFETELASVRLARKAELQGARLTIVDTTAWPGGELAPAQVSAERQKASRFGAADLSLRAPRGVARRFDAAMRGDRRRFAAIEAAYSRAIERDPDSVENHRNRARFRLHTWDWNGALEDLDTILEREPSAPDYIDRARLRAEMGHLEAALTDAEAAWELDQSLPSAFMLSGRLAELGRTEDALALLQEQPAAAEQQQGLALAISELEAQSGRKEEGFQRIDDLVAQRPNDPQLLNAKCWYQATWNYQPDTLEDVCTEAVEKADSSAMVLDSRAMGYYRLGRYQDALKDLESALSASPETAPTLFMRGVVRLQLGDSGGAQDVEEALAREPSLKRSYGRFGITTQ